MPHSSRESPDSRTVTRSWDSWRKPKVFYYEALAEGWPEVVLCQLRLSPATSQVLEFAIFCETEDEMRHVADALIEIVLRHGLVEESAQFITGLCAGASQLSKEGVAIYPPKVLGAPWLYVEAVNDPERPSLARGRYAYRTFTGLHEAETHLNARHRVLFSSDPGAARYRSPSMIPPSLPRFLPGPWE